MELTPRLQLMNWLVSQGLTGMPENDLIRGFCERCRAEGLELSRGTRLHRHAAPDFRGPRFSLERFETNESEISNTARPMRAMPRGWRRSTFHHMLENGHDEMGIDLADCAALDFSMIGDLAAKGHKHLRGLCSPFRRGRHHGPDGLRLFLLGDAAGRRALARGMAALRDLVPVLGLAIKSAAQVDIARTLGRVYLGRDASEQVLRGQIARGVTERINAVLWFSDLRGSTAISETIGPGEIIPFLNDYAQASIDAIHDAGGEVLKLIGDGVLAISRGRMAAAKRAALRADIVSATTWSRSMSAAPPREGRQRPMSACMSARSFTAISAARTGSTSPWSVRRSTKSAASPRCAARSTANCWRRTAFRAGLDAAGRNYLVSTGRFALRGIGRAQDLYTLDPEIAADEVVTGKCERVIWPANGASPSAGVARRAHLEARRGADLSTFPRARDCLGVIPVQRL